MTEYMTEISEKSCYMTEILENGHRFDRLGPNSYLRNILSRLYSKTSTKPKMNSEEITN